MSTISSCMFQANSLRKWVHGKTNEEASGFESVFKTGGLFRRSSIHMIQNKAAAPLMPGIPEFAEIQPLIVAVAYRLYRKPSLRIVIPLDQKPVPDIVLTVLLILFLDYIL